MCIQSIVSLSSDHNDAILLVVKYFWGVVHSVFSCSDAWCTDGVNGS